MLKTEYVFLWSAIALLSVKKYMSSNIAINASNICYFVEEVSNLLSSSQPLDLKSCNTSLEISSNVWYFIPKIFFDFSALNANRIILGRLGFPTGRVPNSYNSG